MLVPYLRPLLLAAISLSSSRIPAKEIVVRPGDDTEAIEKTVTAGDSIVLSNGDWIDAKLKFERLPGEQNSPVVIRAQTPGQVILRGKTQFRISGRHIVVSGLVFRDCDESDWFATRSHSERHASDSRITDCVFQQSAAFEAKKDSRWLSVYGQRNRVDHCYFAGKQSRGTTLVVWVDEQPNSHRIDHNHFGPRPKLGKNGGETIRIGTSEVSELPSNTTVDNNYFFACDGEAEIVSNKSCGNIYRHNVFVECAGAVTMRHGHRCVVDGNVFIGREKKQTGGVRIIGSGHILTNNYFDGLRGDAERAAVSMMNAVPDSELNEYAPVTDAVVVHNTFIRCKVALELGVGAGKKQSIAPKNCRISHNLFAPGKWQISRIHVPLVGFDWTDNKLQSGREPRDAPADFDAAKITFQESQDVFMISRPDSTSELTCSTPSGVTHDIDGEGRTKPTVCGCDIPGKARRKMASPSNTGPTWRTEVLQ